jgi:hypothetical protein
LLPPKNSDLRARLAAVRRLRKKATLDAKRSQLQNTRLRRRHRQLQRTLCAEGTAYQENHAALVAQMPAFERQLAALQVGGGGRGSHIAPCPSLRL